MGGTLFRGNETHLLRRVAVLVARLQSDLQEHRSLRTTAGLFQDAPDYNKYFSGNARHGTKSEVLAEPCGHNRT